MNIQNPNWEKKSDSTLNFTFNWTSWLSGDTITQATISIEGDDESLNVVGTDVGIKKVTVYLSDGTPLEKYTIVCSIDTAKGLSESVRKSIEILN